MRFSRPIRTNVAFNASLRTGNVSYNVVSLINYEPPLPLAAGGATDGTTLTSSSTTTGTGGTIAGTGNWSFAETVETDGVSLLNVKYKERQVHTFLASDL